MFVIMQNIMKCPVYTEKAIKEYKEYCTGIKVHGMRIQTLRFADDIAIIT
jgi:hypothetical protein